MFFFFCDAAQLLPIIIGTQLLIMFRIIINDGNVLYIYKFVKIIMHFLTIR